MIEFSTVASFDFESAEYRQLFTRARPSAFQHPDWLSPFYADLVPRQGAEPLIVAGRSSLTGELVLVVPLLRRRTREAVTVEYAFLGVTDYACPVAVSDVASSADSRLLSKKFLGAIGTHDTLRIEPVREDHLRLWQMLTDSLPSPMDYSAHSVVFDAPYRLWRERNLSVRRRSTLDRKARRLADQGPLRLETLRGEIIRTAFLEARDFRKGRFSDDPLQDDLFLNFYTEVAMRGQASGFARTYRLSAGDKTVAIVFGLIDGKRYCYLVLGCDYESFEKHSPGLVALDLVMADWAKDGGEIFDFTVGDEPFKADFGCEQTPMFRFVRTDEK